MAQVVLGARRLRFIACTVGLAFAWSGCTQLRNGSNSATENGKPARDGGASRTADATATADDADGPTVQVATMSTACSEEGDLACAGGNRNVLVCRASVWQVDKQCSPTERCDSAPGLEAQCLPRADECIAHKSGERFCDASSIMRMCLDSGNSQVVACGKQQHCVTRDNEAICACVPGTADVGAGCQVATDCAAGQGGCDMLTRCSMDGGQRTCSSCPEGYTGTGLTGCTPKLTSLKFSCGEVQSEPSGDSYEYRVRASLLCQRVKLTFGAAPDTHLQIDKVDVPLAGEWSSPPLLLGENVLRLNLISRNGAAREYKVIVDRSGAEDAYIKARTPAVEDGLGFNVGAWGDTLIAGAPYDDSDASGVDGNRGTGTAANSGAAYVFVRQGKTWVQQAYLKADAPSANAYFGTSVAVFEDIAVVGAPGQNPLNFNTAYPMRNGAAYVYLRKNGVWSFAAKLAPKSAASVDLFGFKVAATRDAVFVTDPEDDTGNVRSGAVYAFARTADGWAEQQKLKTSESIEDSVFGFSVSVDGDTLVSGAILDSAPAAAYSGSVYVFVFRGGKWQEQQRLLAPQPKKGGTMGWQLTVQGDTAVVSAPAVNLAASSGLSGQVFIFERKSDKWTQTTTLTAPFPQIDDYFGSGVALRGDTLLIGSNGDRSGSRGPGGDPSRGDATLSGAAYLYVKTDVGWVQTAYLKAPNSEKEDMFGQVVALTDTTALIGSTFEDGESPGINGNQSSNGTKDSGALFVYR